MPRDRAPGLWHRRALACPQLVLPRPYARGRPHPRGPRPRLRAPGEGQPGARDPPGQHRRPQRRLSRGGRTGRSHTARPGQLPRRGYNEAMRTLAILVGSGPAPGINAVIAAATIEARNRGLRVLGCHDGYQWLMQKDLGHVEELEIAALSRIHFEGGSVLRTSRANPSRSAETLQSVAESLQRLGASY